MEYYLATKVYGYTQQSGLIPPYPYWMKEDTEKMEYKQKASIYIKF